MAVDRLLSVEQLADVLHRSPSTVRVDCRRAPHKLPPRLCLPGSTRLVWLEDDVNEWLRRYRRPGTSSAERQDMQAAAERLQALGQRAEQVED